MRHDVVIHGNIVMQTGTIAGGWLAIKGDTISGLFPAGDRPDANRVVDAAGCWVMPGVVDAHVHSGSSRDEPEGFTRLTATAAVGGVTTVIDMPYDGSEPTWSVKRLHRKVKAIERDAIVDVALFGTVNPCDGWKDVVPLALEGVCGFKLSTYETDPVRFPRIPESETLRVLAEIQKVDRTVAFHAENGEIIDPLIETLRPYGVDSPEAHCWSRPIVAETTSVATLLELVRHCPVRLHIVHLTAPFGYDLVSWYRSKGVDATAETCTHYLVLDESNLRNQRGFAKCNPPLRSAEDREALWEKVADGSVDFVTSDHVPWPESAKLHPNIFDNASGLPGVGQLLPLLYSHGVVERNLPIQRLAQLVSTNPAKRYGLYPRKGALLIGGDADVVVLDPEVVSKVDTSDSPSVAKWSPYNGLEITGAVLTTWSRGQLVFDRGDLVGEPGHGRFIAPQA